MKARDKSADQVVCPEMEQELFIMVFICFLSFFCTGLSPSLTFCPVQTKPNPKFTFPSRLGMPKLQILEQGLTLIKAHKLREV